MANIPTFRSVHPYLNYVENFILEMRPVLAGNRKLLRRQEFALKAIDRVITELSPIQTLGCPRGQQVVSFLRSPSVTTSRKK
jgi:hypothetical protein